MATPSDAGSGALTGRRRHQTFTIYKEVDASSPVLFQASRSGQHFQKAQLFLAHKVKGSPQDFLEIQLTNVSVQGFVSGISSGGDRPTESVSFTYTKATESFVSASDNHQPSDRG